MSLTRRGLLTLCALLVIATAAHTSGLCGGQDILDGGDLFKAKTGESVISVMHEAYKNKWYRTTTFTQITTRFGKDGSKEASTWYEAITMPGKLRIDFDPLAKKDGLLFNSDKIYSFKDGQLEKSQPLVHPLLLLGFDVYFLPVSDSIAKLKALKFDLSLFREDTWQGRPVYVVGAEAGDLHSPQFWIDKRRLYFVRLLRPAGKDGVGTEEIQFNNYQRLGGGWIAAEVIFMTDGVITTTEAYSDILGNVKLDEELFDPLKWSTAKHWKH